MTLTTKEESLIAAVRALPQREAEKVLTWAAQLSSLAQGREVEWSDSWSEEDLADATAASVQLLEHQEKDSR